ncbi:MAG: retroviral-like aspartic protease family protein, partial [Cyanobacteria bacterium J06632_22]
QAETQVQQGQYRAALETLNWLLQLAPNHAQALSQRAVVHVHCQAPQLAAKDMAQALALAPNDLTMRLQRGEMRQLMGDCAGAIADCTAVIQQQPNKPQAYLLRAQAHAQLGQAEAAFKDVSNALALAPDNVAAYQLRGQVCATAADLEDALANYRKAASLALEQGNWLTHQTLQRQLQALNERLQAQKAETARTIRIPIKHLSGGTPVVVVTLNGLPFDMVLDTGAGITQVTLQMSQLLNITALRSGYFRMADGRTVQQSMGRVQSAKLGQAQVNNLEVSISPTASEGLLGQNFLWRYDVKILRTEIELYLR